MDDLFRPETNLQLMREARLGLLILAVTASVFAYVVFNRISSGGADLPEHVLQAPIAESVWPGEDQGSPAPSAENESIQTSFGKMISRARQSFGLGSEREPESGSLSSQTRLDVQRPGSDLARLPDSTIRNRKKPTEFELSSVLRQSVGTINKSKLAGFKNPAPEKQPSPPADTVKEGQDKESPKIPLSKMPNSKTSASPMETKLKQTTVLASYQTKTPNASTPSLEDQLNLGTSDIAKTMTRIPQQQHSGLKNESDISRQEYAVQQGDGFWSVAQNAYGDGRFFRALFEYNRNRVGSFESLSPGISIAVPPRIVLEKEWPELCPATDNLSVANLSDPRIYVTKSGDTLFGIARQRLGQASRYLSILKANKKILGPNTSHLTPLPSGVQLLIPSATLH